MRATRPQIYTLFGIHTPVCWSGDVETLHLDALTKPHISKVTYLFTLIYDLLHKPG
jgi:hypothetical protein